MNQQRIKNRPTLAVISALFTLGVGLTSAGLIIGDAMPRLTSGNTLASAAPQQDDVRALPSGHQALTQLQRSLQRLSAPATRNEPLAHRTGRLPVETGPRIAGRIDRPATPDDAAASIARVAVDLTRIERDLGVAAPRKYTPRIDVATLDSALQRFDRVSGPIASETFARVYLGLSEMVPKLSDRTAYHSRVPKADLRAQVIEARMAASLEASPTLTTAKLITQTHGQAVTAPRLLGEIQPGDTAMLDADPMEIAGLTAPVGQLALGTMTAAPDDLGSALPYDETQLALDDIDIDALGDTDLASLESPVDAEQLQETRAGFVLDNGVQIDFNVTRLTVIEELGQQTALNLTNMPQGLDQASLARVTAGQQGNTRVITQTQDTAVFSVVQNSLDNQAIYDLTTINVDIKNLGLQSLDFVPESLKSDTIPSEFKGGR